MTSGYHFNPSSGSFWVRPRWNSPPGMKTIPGSAAWATSAKQRLSEQSRNFIRWNVAVGSERINVGIRAPRRRIANFFTPVDAQRRVHGGQHILHAWLFLVVPTDFQRLRT